MSYLFERRINYYETDRMGVVHHSNYIRYLEEARCFWLEELQMPFSLFEEKGITIPVLGVNCRYQYHVTFDDTIQIYVSIKEYTGSSDVTGITDYCEYSGKGVGCNYCGVRLLAGNLKLMAENGVKVSRVHEGYGSVVYFAEDGKELGYIALSDSVREGAKEVVSALKAQGKRVIMLTGDVETSAKHVAEEVGIDEYYAALLPQNKFEKVEKLKNEGEKVMFVGDGLNDAPAIKTANLGVCVGGLGNDASVEASDVVLSTGSVAGLPYAFGVAKETKKRVAENVWLSLVAKAAIMIVSLAWVPMMWLAVVADVGVCIIAIINSVRR